MAGKTSLVHEQYRAVDFENSFESSPVVIASVMTYNGPATVTDRIRNVTTAGFEVQLQEEEAADHRHNREELGWIAIDRGAATSGETDLNAIVNSPVYHQPKRVAFGGVDGANKPVILSDMQTRNGGDTATVRHTASGSDHVWLMIEEERSRDSEIGHAGESVGVIAFEPGALVAVSQTSDGNRAFVATNSATESDTALPVTSVRTDAATEKAKSEQQQKIQSMLNSLVSEGVSVNIAGAQQNLDSAAKSDGMPDFSNSETESEKQTSETLFDDTSLLDRVFEELT